MCKFLIRGNGADIRTSHRVGASSTREQGRQIRRTGCLLAVDGSPGFNGLRNARVLSGCGGTGPAEGSYGAMGGVLPGPWRQRRPLLPALLRQSRLLQPLSFEVGYAGREHAGSRHRQSKFVPEAHRRRCPIDSRGDEAGPSASPGRSLQGSSHQVSGIGSPSPNDRLSSSMGLAGGLKWL